MKKFMYIFYGSWEEHSKDVMDTWTKWFGAIGDKIVDSGNPFGPGREVTRNGTKQLPAGRQAVAGYTIVSAASMDEAEKMLKGCPMVTSVQVYEAIAM